ncbi:MAG: hypothetical protein LAT65_20630 [Saccharospirillum sp.]|nr:hypothetical protein [Saccharospirillum sp.]
MPLRKAPLWTDIYYQAVEEYFWRPQVIGRISNPNKPSKPWSFWRSRLAKQEVPLNHILDFLFHIAPQALLDEVLVAMLGESMSGFELVAPSEGLIDDNVVQPDIMFSNGKSLVFVEMKVDSKSSIDQFVKYAIAALQICADEPSLERVDLVILSRHSEHSKVWSRAKKFELDSTSALKATAIQGLKGDAFVWTQPGVRKFTSKNPELVPKLIEKVESMGLTLIDYPSFSGVLRQFASEEPTVSRLVGGVLDELSRRGLITEDRHSELAPFLWAP